jgi:hypothetical protein
MCNCGISQLETRLQDTIWGHFTGKHKDDPKNTWDIFTDLVAFEWAFYMHQIILRKHLKTSNQTVRTESQPPRWPSTSSPWRVAVERMAWCPRGPWVTPIRSRCWNSLVPWHGRIEKYGWLICNYGDYGWLWIFFGSMNHTLFGTINRTHHKLWLAMFCRGRIQTTMGNGTICRYYIAAWCNVWPPR